jgi:hypothetical protein
MVLIESNSIKRDMQDQIFFFRVLFGLVTTESNRANDGAAKSVLATEV